MILVFCFFVFLQLLLLHLCRCEDQSAVCLRGAGAKLCCRCCCVRVVCEDQFVLLFLLFVWKLGILGANLGGFLKCFLAGNVDESEREHFDISLIQELHFELH